MYRELPFYVLTFSFLYVGSYSSENQLLQDLYFESGKNHAYVGSNVTIILRFTQLINSSKIFKDLQWKHLNLQDESIEQPQWQGIGEDEKIFKPLDNPNYIIEKTTCLNNNSNNILLPVSCYKFHFKPVLWKDNGSWSAVLQAEYLLIDLNILIKKRDIENDEIYSIDSLLVIDMTSEKNLTRHHSLAAVNSPLYTDNAESTNEELMLIGSELEPYDLRSSNNKQPRLFLTCISQCSRPSARLRWRLRNTTHLSQTFLMEKSLQKKCLRSRATQSNITLVISCSSINLFGLTRVDCIDTDDLPEEISTFPLWKSERVSMDRLIQAKRPHATIFILCPGPSQQSGFYWWEISAIVIVAIVYFVWLLVMIHKGVSHRRQSRMILLNKKCQSNARHEVLPHLSVRNSLQ